MFVQMSVPPLVFLFDTGPHVGRDPQETRRSLERDVNTLKVCVPGFTIYFTLNTTHNVTRLCLFLSFTARDQHFTSVCIILMSIQSRMATLLSPTLRKLEKQRAKEPFASLQAVIWKIDRCISNLNL